MLDSFLTVSADLTISLMKDLPKRSPISLCAKFAELFNINRKEGLVWRSMDWRRAAVTARKASPTRFRAVETASRCCSLAPASVARKKKRFGGPENFLLDFEEFSLVRAY